MFRDFTRILEQTRKRLSVCKYIRLVDPVKGKNGVFDYDRSKLVFSTRASLLSGSDLYHILLDRYHIQMEMESENYALAIAAVGDREEGFERLCQAIEELDQEQADLIKAGIPAEENKKLDTRSHAFCTDADDVYGRCNGSTDRKMSAGRKHRQNFSGICLSVSTGNSADHSGRTDYWTIYP